METSSPDGFADLFVTRLPKHLRDRAVWIRGTVPEWILAVGYAEQDHARDPHRRERAAFLDGDVHAHLIATGHGGDATSDACAGRDEQRGDEAIRCERGFANQRADRGSASQPPWPISQSTRASPRARPRER